MRLGGGKFEIRNLSGRMDRASSIEHPTPIDSMADFHMSLTQHAIHSRTETCLSAFDGVEVAPQDASDVPMGPR